MTHICAPVFILTAGLGAYFYWSTGRRTKRQVSAFLFTRGLWLIVLELTVMQLALGYEELSAPSAALGYEELSAPSAALGYEELSAPSVALGHEGTVCAFCGPGAL